MKSVRLTASLIDIAVYGCENFTFSGIDDDGDVSIWSLEKQWDGTEIQKQNIRMENKILNLTAQCWHDMVHTHFLILENLLLCMVLGSYHWHCRWFAVFEFP